MTELEENKENLEKKKGSRFKTPSQVQALEEFYNEHKYPTDSMKAEVADRIGLTEKQVSGWFCHRRLKDKKLMKDEAALAATGGGRQDLSSGVIQDHGSGLRQDSCGSTKQTDHHRPSDLREVESRRLSGEEDRPLAVPTYEQGQQYYDVNGNGNGNGRGGASSESDFDLQEEEGFYPEGRRNLLNVEISRYVTPNGFTTKGRGRTGPSGYLKIKGQTENAAITAVKRQLGRHYREDGPPLGVDFESLPPGAFEFPIKHTARGEPYRGLEPILRSPVDITAHRKQARVCSMNPDSDEEEAMSTRTLHVSNQDGLSYRQPSKQKTLVSPSRSNPYPHEKSRLGIEYPATEASARDSSFNFGVRNNHGLNASRPDSIANRHLQTSAGKIAISQYEPLKHKYVDQRREIREPKGVSSIVKQRDSFDSEEIVPASSLMDEELYELKSSQPSAHQDGELYRQKRSMREHLPVPARLKRGRDETQKQQNHATPPHRAKPSSGSAAAEIPSNFSEAEIAETSSSVD